MMVCRLTNSVRRFEGRKCLRNVGNYSPNDTTSHANRHYSSSPQRTPQVPQFLYRLCKH